MNKVISFHGSDHKVGTSQISQCTAEVFAKSFPKSSVLLIQADGGPAPNYCNKLRETIEGIRPFLAQEIVNIPDIKEKSFYKDNLYIIGGQNKPGMSEYLTPDMGEILVDALRDEFDLIILDTGSEIEDGFSLGAILASDSVYMVINQSESSLRRYEWYSFLFDHISLDFDSFILNKYNKNSVYEKEYIAERLLIDKAKIITIREDKRGADAEMLNESLISAKASKSFKNDIEKLVKDIANNAGITA